MGNIRNGVIYDSEPEAHVHNGGFIHIEPEEDSYTTKQDRTAPFIRSDTPDRIIANEDKATPAYRLHDEQSNSDRTLGNSHQDGGIVCSDQEDRSDGGEMEKQSNGGEKGDRPDGGEKGGEEGPPKPVGFWHKDLSKTRLKVFRLWIGITLLLMTFVLAVLSLYWSVLFHVDANLNSLIVFVVDFDGQVAPYLGGTPMIGPLITRTTEAQVRENSMPHLGYVTVPPSAYSYDPIQVREAIYGQQAWAAIVINANATALLRQAVEQGNATYDPLGACQIIYVQARDQTTYSEYILPQINTLQTEVTSMFGQMWARQVLANTSIPRTTLQQVPQALSPAIGFSMFNLRPFQPPTATPTVTVGLIYLIIIAFFSFTFYMQAHMKFLKEPGHAPLRFWQWVLWRWLSTIAGYFFTSLAYSLVSLAFQVHFTAPPAPHTEVANNATAFGHGSFPVFWMLNFVGMIALGMASDNVAMIIGMPWVALWLIFWVITNVCPSFYAIEVEPHFFYWGYAWPLHNIVEATRTIVFDTHSRLGLNFGVLFAWAGINSILFPFCCYFMWWMEQRSQKKDKEKKDQ